MYSHKTCQQPSKNGSLAGSGREYYGFPIRPLRGKHNVYILKDTNIISSLWRDRASEKSSLGLVLRSDREIHSEFPELILKHDENVYM